MSPAVITLVCSLLERSSVSTLLSYPQQKLWGAAFLQNRDIPRRAWSLSFHVPHVSALGVAGLDPTLWPRSTGVGNGRDLPSISLAAGVGARIRGHGLCQVRLRVSTWPPPLSAHRPRATGQGSPWLQKFHQAGTVWALSPLMPDAGFASDSGQVPPWLRPPRRGSSRAGPPRGLHGAELWPWPHGAPREDVIGHQGSGLGIAD